MDLTVPTFWLLDGRTGWRTGSAAGTDAAADGIRLAAAPDGPLALDSDDGSLGKLVLPPTLAISADGDVFLLRPEDARILAFDAGSASFEPLETVGGVGTEAREFTDPSAIAVAGRTLYVVDRGNHRVQIFSLDSLALLAVWKPCDASGRPVDAADPDAWDPVDVTSAGRFAYLLDYRYGRVFCHDSETGAVVRVVDRPDAAWRWSRVAVDRTGLVYLYDRGRKALDVFGPDGEARGSAGDAGEVRDRFDPPPLLVDRGRFCLPADLMRPCDRRPPACPPSPEHPLAACVPGPGGRVFRLDGSPVDVDPAETPGPPLYARTGVWVSEALDSEVYDCLWHSIELDLGALPPGCSLEVRTYTDAEPRPIAEILALPDDLWETRQSFVGEMQPPDVEPAARHEEMLVQSASGRYLWLRLALSGDGRVTPSVEAARVHFPRESYLADLPAIYGSDDESRSFLERFLAIVQTEWDRLGQTIDDLPALFEPAAVPGGKALEYLAGWLDLPLEGDWDDGARRHLLEGAVGVYGHRGTVAGVREYLRLYLENITGQPVEADGYPQVVEGFRERSQLLLSLDPGSLVPHGAPLWSESVTGRLRLGESRAGDARLGPTGSPTADVFEHYAHRFRVFVPAAWVQTADAERMVRRALDAEKPAHTSYDLDLVEPRVRVGVQSTVGLDTIIGGYPEARLHCAHELPPAPSLPPRGRLGYDTLLRCRREEVRLGPERRARAAIGAGSNQRR